MDRDYYEKEISNILKEYEKMDISVSEYYRMKTIKMLLEIDNVEVLEQVCKFVNAIVN